MQESLQKTDENCLGWRCEIADRINKLEAVFADNYTSRKRGN